MGQVEFGGQKLSLMTSHFESCKANSAERMRQLRQLMKMMSRAPDDQTVLFGGDTNLRDHEVRFLTSPSRGRQRDPLWFSLKKVKSRQEI